MVLTELTQEEIENSFAGIRKMVLNIKELTSEFYEKLVCDKIFTELNKLEQDLVKIGEKHFDKFQTKEWCKCLKEGEAIYFPDNSNPITKHHYRCGNCGGIIQIG